MSPTERLGEFDLTAGLRSTVRLNNGVRMPVLGLGVWKTPPGRVTQDAVARALEVGYRLIDTAKLYGNEKDVGAAIRASGIPRDEIFVTTKVWNDDQGYEPTLAAFDRSQKDLGVGEIDLYLLHWPVPRRRLDSWRALEHLLGEGRCRAIGVSNFSVQHLDELAAHSSTVPAVNQVEFSPFLFQRELLEHGRAHGIQLEAYAPLTRGQRLMDPAIMKVGRDRGKTPAQVVLRWALQHQAIVIPKTVHVERMRENAGVFDFTLSPAEMTTLDRLNGGYHTAWDPAGVT
ncbi:MAG: aldo/keto reductase [Thermoplasmata archaeon]|nr:aldo/keto reductase [Thermoplasmata archaeon]